MPWKETCAMTERLRFIALFEEGNVTMAALCREFGISRKTGYQLLARYAAEGEDGLRDRSHAAHHHPQAVSEAMEASILTLRAKRPTWGARKLRARLQIDDPAARWPAASTIGELLHRHGLVIPRRRRRVHRLTHRRLRPAPARTTVGASITRAGSALAMVGVAIH